jgi:arylsulfatase A-like enzyme
MRFTDAHSASAVCTPTRYGLLTGRYPWRIGQYGVLTTFSRPVIPPSRLTVASLFKQNGYATGCFGKWHLGTEIRHAAAKDEGTDPQDGEGEGAKRKGKKGGKVAREPEVPAGTAVAEGPLARGFDSFAGYTHARNIGMILENDLVGEEIAPVEVQPLLARKTVEFIERQAKEGKPFFLYVPLATPHTPHVPAEEFRGKTEAGAAGDWLFEGDWVVGRLLEVLDRLRLAENTLLIAASDNGWPGPNPPLRAGKASIYEGGHRVPFIARWPGRIRPGSVCEETVCLNDLMATAAELLGVKLSDGAGEDSVSLLPLLRGTARGPVREATVHQSAGGDVAIRQGPWKLVLLKKGARELYDLKQDPGEKNDVAAANPEAVERLAKLLEKYVTEGRSTPGPPQKNDVAVKFPK